MIGNYKGHYPFNESSILTNAPNNIGVYYCGILNSDGSLGVLYVGRAKGENVTIRSRLLEHLNNDKWYDVTHFGFYPCSSEEEIENFEKLEIAHLNIPKYNKRIG